VKSTAAIELEAISEIVIEESYNYKIIKQDMYIVEPYEIVIKVLKDNNKNEHINIFVEYFTYIY